MELTGTDRRTHKSAKTHAGTVFCDSWP